MGRGLTGKMAALSSFEKVLGDENEDFRWVQEQGASPQSAKEFEELRFAYIDARNKLAAFLKIEG